MKKLVTIFFFSVVMLTNISFSQSTETFEGTSLPSGWINSGCISTANNFCAGSRSCGFNGVGDNIITPLIVNGSTISLDYRRSSNTTAWTLEVETSSSTTGPWSSVGSITNASTTCQNASFSIPANVYVRFRDARTTGAQERYIDNVTVGDNSLPVSLTSFTIKATPVPFLEWQTATERNNSHFEIERSGDGATFEKIGEVAGKGNSVEEVRYSFEDKAPLSGVNYYRLRQVDFDGAFEYSAVRSVVFGSTKKVTVFPAPVASVMTIQLDEAFKNDAQWQITDMAGRLVAEGVFVAEQNQLNIPVNNLTEGVYVLRIVAAQETITRQFRKI